MAIRLASAVVVLAGLVLVWGLATRSGEAAQLPVTGSVQIFTPVDPAAEPVYEVGQRCDTPNPAGGPLTGDTMRVVALGAEGQILGLFTATEPTVIASNTGSVSCQFRFAGELPDTEPAWQFVVTEGPEVDAGLVPVVYRPDEIQDLMATDSGFILQVSEFGVR